MPPKISTNSANPTHDALNCREMLLRIFSFLTPQEIAKIALVCHNWNEVTNDFTLWKDFIRIDFGKEVLAEAQKQFAINSAAQQNPAIPHIVTNGLFYRSFYEKFRPIFLKEQARKQLHHTIKQNLKSQPQFNQINNEFHIHVVSGLWVENDPLNSALQKKLFLKLADPHKSLLGIGRYLNQQHGLAFFLENNNSGNKWEDLALFISLAKINRRPIFIVIFPDSVDDLEKTNMKIDCAFNPEAGNDLPLHKICIDIGYVSELAKAARNMDIHCISIPALNEQDQTAGKKHVAEALLDIATLHFVQQELAQQEQQAAQQEQQLLLQTATPKSKKNTPRNCTIC